VQALARALYSRCSILLLDDLFSSLDRKTQQTVASRLLSSDGHAKKHGITILFTTHSGRFVYSLMAISNLLSRTCTPFGKHHCSRQWWISGLCGTNRGLEQSETRSSGRHGFGRGACGRGTTKSSVQKARRTRG
jgi:ABC-type Mn2+/Zn2+ transport system ATPase subunit